MGGGIQGQQGQGPPGQPGQERPAAMGAGSAIPMARLVADEVGTGVSLADFRIAPVGETSSVSS